MGARGFQPGNQLAAKSRMFERVLHKAIVQDNAVRLRNAAERLLDAASDGQAWAIQFLALKLDGPSLPKVDSDGQAFSITWSFGAAPQVIDSHQQSQLVDGREPVTGVNENDSELAPTPQGDPPR